MSLEQISERLRIEPRALIALEQERFEAIGAPVFVKGYLRHYSDYLGLDTERLLAVYRSEHGADEPVVQARRSVGYEEQRPAVSTWMAAAVAAALVAAVLWLLREPALNAPGEQAAAIGDDEVAELESARDAPPVALRPSPPSAERRLPAEPAAGSLEESASLPVEASPRARSEADAADAADVNAQGDVAGGPRVDVAAGIEAEPEADSETDSESRSRRQAEAARREITATLPSDSAELDISVRFLEDSWTEVVDARDTRLFYGLGRAGADARFNAVAPVTVLFGNADGVVIEVDGEPFAYPENSRRGRLARFTLSTPAE